MTLSVWLNPPNPLQNTITCSPTSIGDWSIIVLTLRDPVSSLCSVTYFMICHPPPICCDISVPSSRADPAGSWTRARGRCLPSNVTTTVKPSRPPRDRQSAGGCISDTSAIIPQVTRSPMLSLRPRRQADGHSHERAAVTGMSNCGTRSARITGWGETRRRLFLRRRLINLHSFIAT